MFMSSRNLKELDALPFKIFNICLTRQTVLDREIAFVSFLSHVDVQWDY